MLKLLHIIHQSIITDMEENKALENRENKTVSNENDKKKQIKEALREARNIKVKPDAKPKTIKKIKHEENNNKIDENQQTLDTYRNKPMKNTMEHDETKFDEELYELIDENDLNFCGKQILKQAIEHPETAHKQIRKTRKMQNRTRKEG